MQQTRKLSSLSLGMVSDWPFIICLLQWTMKSLRKWIKSISPLQLQNLAKYLVYVYQALSKCQWMNIQLSQLCSSPSLALLVFYEPRKLCPTFPSFHPLPILPSHSSPFESFCVMLPFLSLPMLSGALVCVPISVEPPQASLSSFQQKCYQSCPQQPGQQVHHLGSRLRLQD